MRIGPSHPWLGAAGFHLTLPLLEFFYRKLAIYRSESRFARERVRAIKDKIERGETVYLAGVSSAGIHNSGVALVEVTRNGPRLLFNNEEERFSAVKHTNKYPEMSIEALRAAMARMGLDIRNIDAWFTSWDYAALGGDADPLAAGGVAGQYRHDEGRPDRAVQSARLRPRLARPAPYRPPVGIERMGAADRHPAPR